MPHEQELFFVESLHFGTNSSPRVFYASEIENRKMKKYVQCQCLDSIPELQLDFDFFIDLIENYFYYYTKYYFAFKAAFEQEKNGQVGIIAGIIRAHNCNS